MTGLVDHCEEWDRLPVRHRAEGPVMPFRGVVFGLLLVAPVWLAAVGFVWWVLS